MVEYKFKVCLMGEPGVGKTSLIRRFVYGVFSDRYLKTIGTNVYKKVVELGNKKITLMIWDIMGEDTFRQLLKTSYFYGAEGLIAVGDISNKDSLVALDDWVNAAEGVIGKKVPLLIIANKSDLQWDVDEEYLMNLRDSLGAINYFITSAKTGENVNELFESMARCLSEKLTK